MAIRFPAVRNGLTALLLTVVVAGAPAVALAQDPHAAPKQQKKLPEPPGKLPKVGADKTRGLDFLFGALKAAPDEASAKHVEARIWALWLQTPSDTAALLMMRAKTAMDAQQVDVALKLLDAVVKLRPDYVEGWNRRATLYYLKNDYAHSLEDIEQVLVRDPRHCILSRNFFRSRELARLTEARERHHEIVVVGRRHDFCDHDDLFRGVA